MEYTCYQHLHPTGHKQLKLKELPMVKINIPQFDNLFQDLTFQIQSLDSLIFSLTMIAKTSRALLQDMSELCHDEY